MACVLKSYFTKEIIDVTNGFFNNSYNHTIRV